MPSTHTESRLSTDARALTERQLDQRVLQIRGELVMLDRDLAELYGVETRSLNQAVTRNLNRFPPDFMFQLEAHEAAALRLQNATSKPSRGGRRYAPRVFTEQGVAMLSSVLRSDRAVQVNIAIMRAFVRLRQLTTAHGRLAEKVDRLEQQMDAKFRVVFTVIQKRSAPVEPEPETSTRRIGFVPDEPDATRRGRGRVDRSPAMRSVPRARSARGRSTRA